jgi:hypothetical protein
MTTTSISTDAPATSSLLRVAVVASAGAGLVHAAAAGSHQGDTWLAVAFALAALAQLGWAAATSVAPRPASAWVGAAVNGGLVGLWAWSRLWGWPVIESVARPQAVGFHDGVAAALAAVAVAAAIGSTRRRAPRPGRLGVVAVSVVVLAAAVPAMVTDHAHDHHDHGEAAAHDHGGGGRRRDRGRPGERRHRPRGEVRRCGPRRPRPRLDA